MWIACPACRPHTLTHYATTDWRLQPVSLSFAQNQKYLDGSLVFGNTSEKPRIDECLSATLTLHSQGSPSENSHHLQFFLGNRVNNQITPSTPKGSLSENQIAHLPLNPIFKRSIVEIAFRQGVTYTYQESDQTTRLISLSNNTYLFRFSLLKPPSAVTEQTYSFNLRSRQYQIAIPPDQNAQKQEHIDFYNQVVRVLSHRSLYFESNGQVLEIPFGGLSPAVTVDDSIHALSSVEIAPPSWSQGTEVLFVAEITEKNQFLANLTTCEFWIGPSHLPRNENWPKLVEFHDNRLIYAATEKNPQALWLSNKGIFDSFGPHIIQDPVTAAEHEAADSRIIVSLGGRDLDALEWLHSTRDGLLIATARGQWLLHGDGPLTPSSIRADKVSHKGSRVQGPAAIDDRLLFAAEDGLYALVFSTESRGYRLYSLSLAAEHLFHNETVKRVVYQDESIWCLLESGRVVSCVSHDGGVGWSRHDFGAPIREIASDGQTLWLIRDLDTSRSLEVLDLKSETYLDSWRLYSGRARTTFSGYDAFSGRLVEVEVDGRSIARFTMATDGRFRLPEAVDEFRIGEVYRSRYVSRRTHPFGKRGRVKEVIIRSSGDEALLGVVSEPGAVLENGWGLSSPYTRLTPQIETARQAYAIIESQSALGLRLEGVMVSVEVFDE